uniref:Cilia- and flagella-associated protein 251-like n=1 Tax=Takifugu rubripes TaxID=31033 RepID=A0A674NE67_TAKRU
MSSLEDHEENSENHREADFIESDGGTNTPIESAETPNPTKSDERSEANEEEERSEANEEEERSEANEEEERSEANEEEERSEANEEEENSVRTPEEDNAEMKVCGDLILEFKLFLHQMPNKQCDSFKMAKFLPASGMGFRLASSGQYELAVKFFTDAISYNPKEFKLFGNRSLCYERLQQYENACRDADVALLIEPKWIKGLFRKGKALCGLKRYYEASLVYREVMDLDSSSTEAKQELKRAQTLHLTVGVSLIRDLSRRPRLEETLVCDSLPRIMSCFISGNGIQLGREFKASASLSGVRAPPTPQAARAGKPYVVVCAITVYSRFVQTSLSLCAGLFSRAGTVYSIKMLLEHQCAFVNYTRGEDCHRAIQHLDGMILEGAPLSVRYPSPSLCTDPCRSKECFFWRTMGCTRPDCVYKHDPNHRGIDRHKFTTGLGNFHT